MRLPVADSAQQDLSTLLETEWLLTDGAGGYASGAVVGCNTRKYHALLVCRPPGLQGPFVILSQIEDSVQVAGRAWELSTHEYPGVLHPDGYRNLEYFELLPMPHFAYRCGEVMVHRRILLPETNEARRIRRKAERAERRPSGAPDRDAVLIRYDLESVGGPASVRLRLRPQFAFRNIHRVWREFPEPRLPVHRIPNGVRLDLPEGLLPVYAVTNVRSEFDESPCWYRNVRYRRDAERGFEHEEDLFCPGSIEVTLRKNRPVVFVVSLNPPPEGLRRWWTALEQRQCARPEPPAAGPPRSNEPAERRQILRSWLDRAADDFLIYREDTGPAVHAGYPWFGPWGRDTLIALPGLMFARGRLDAGLDVLSGMARFEQRGLLPNFVEEKGNAVYTAADPALWFFWTIQQYIGYGGDVCEVRERLLPVMVRILEAYRRGTDNDIRLDEKTGLIRCGRPGMAATWMDAQIHGRPVVPRWGLVVEINALWYNALRFTLALTNGTGDQPVWLDEAFCEQVRSGFVRTFWLPDQAMLLDNVNDVRCDAAVRPNQVFAVSLPFSPLNAEQQRAVVETVRDELYTPRGLRTLSPNDVRYRRLCRGDQWTREIAYYQGAVRPWLAAHFADAYFRVHGLSAETVAMFDPLVSSFLDHLGEAGLGSVSEVFDGDPPHAPGGAIAQAWNVGELLRLLDRLDSVETAAQG